MSYTELIAKDIAELKEILKEKQILIFGLKTKLKLMQVKNTAELRIVKKDIARIKMAINYKENGKEKKSA